MQSAIERLGYYPRFINYRKKADDSDRSGRWIIKSICHSLSSILPFLPKCDTYAFRRDNYHETAKVYDREGAIRLCNEFDAVICGSDQIWAPNVFDSVYMLDGVAPRVKKISYAASIGLPEIPEHLKDAYRTLLSRFDVIGVREEQARSLLSSEFGIESTAVLDPTFLLEKDDWLRVAVDSHRDCDCVFCYFLGNPARYQAYVDWLSKHLGLRVVAYIPASNRHLNSATIIRRMSPPDFLARVRDSAMVLTDSFHGVSLSINFSKDFVAFKRFDDGDRLNQNSRVLNILSKLSLESQLLDPSERRTPEPDWAAAGLSLASERVSSWAFLREALGGVVHA